MKHLIITSLIGSCLLAASVYANLATKNSANNSTATVYAANDRAVRDIRLRGNIRQYDAQQLLRALCTRRHQPNRNRCYAFYFDRKKGQWVCMRYHCRTNAPVHGRHPGGRR